MPVPPPDATDFFTVEEAARILRIGRTAAYGLARTWRETDGREGLPVVAFGRLLRVPRAALEALTGGPITSVNAVEKKKSVSPDPATGPMRVRSELARPPRRRHSRARSSSPDQTTFPFT